MAPGSAVEGIGSLGDLYGDLHYIGMILVKMFGIYGTYTHIFMYIYIYMYHIYFHIPNIISIFYCCY